jgi:hypothetical protein
MFAVTKFDNATFVVTVEILGTVWSIVIACPSFPPPYCLGEGHALLYLQSRLEF